jgi:hypothetical protein
MSDDLEILTALRKKVPFAEFDYTVLMSVLQNYAKPRDCISKLMRHGRIIRVKKGLYVLGAWARAPYSRERLANLIYGPSYISKEYALAYYGFIPEAVHMVTSMTLKRSKDFFTPVGDFSYTQLSQSRYVLGVQQQEVDGYPPVLFATPEKAILDTVPFSDFRTKPALATYLIENLRIDESSLATLNSARLQSFVPAYTQTLIQNLIRVVEGCQRG